MLNKLNKIPGQISDQNCEKIYSILNQIYSGNGNLIELGTFLGKVTYILQEVCKKKNNKRVISYDHFKWTKNHSWKFPNLKINIGEETREFIYKYLDKNIVKLEQSMHDKINYRGDKIEILILDAPKNYDDLKKTFQNFQDFFLNQKTYIFFLDSYYPKKIDFFLFCYNFKDCFDFYFLNNFVYAKFKTKLDFSINKKKDVTDQIILFWKDLKNKIGEINFKELSIFPALHLYHLSLYKESIRYILFNDNKLNNKYIFNRYFVKKYAILIPVIVIKKIANFIKRL